MTAKETIGTWPRNRPREDRGSLNLSSTAAQANAATKAGRAGARREAETVNRLVRIAGEAEPLADAARRLQVRPKVLLDRLRIHRNPSWPDLETWAATVHAKEPPTACEP